MRYINSTGWRAMLLAYAPVVFWIGLIFYFSSDLGSMSSTSRFMWPLLQFLFPDAPAETIRLYHGYIRKAAHFFAYAVLALLALRAFSSATRGILFSHRFAISMTLVLLVAVLDELNQSLMRSRTGSVYDGMLDGLGGFSALSVIYMLNRRRHRGRNRQVTY